MTGIAGNKVGCNVISGMGLAGTGRDRTGQDRERYGPMKLAMPVTTGHC